MSGPQAAPRLLAGWGRTAPTLATVAEITSEEQVSQQVRSATERGVIPRGLGRSYGDAAQCAGGLVLDCTTLKGITSADLEGGTVTAYAGTSIDSLLRTIVPRGWFVPVTPGTRFVTLGGALAGNIHGKNHHRDGSFARHVSRFTLVTPDGELRRVSQAADPRLFWATAGGMGLTGVVTDMTLALLPIETSSMLVDTQRCSDLDAVVGRMDEGDARYRYSVAWIDLMARGRGMGRSILTRGDHAPAALATSKRKRDPLRYQARQRMAAPPWVPSGLLNRLTIGAFNELWFRKAPRERREELQSIAGYFHPLDMIRGWNRLYGRLGFLQYQFVVPFGAENELRRIVERLSEWRCPSFLAVLKRFGAADPGPLSFPIPGWTLALDLPAGDVELRRMLDSLDVVVAEAGGRVYFAKDSRLRPDLLAAMYPDLDDWRKLRGELDPKGLFRSDLSRRLDL